jgi:hypothetical protein
MSEEPDVCEASVIPREDRISIHQNARLTPLGREEMALAVEDKQLAANSKLCTMESAMIIEISSRPDVAKWSEIVSVNARRSLEAIARLSLDPLMALSQMKFEQIGFHPLQDRELNLIEQVNQTFTYLVALRSVELLLDWHPDIGGFRLAPGAHAPKGSLDIESLAPGFVGAETFAAVHPRSNDKRSSISASWWSAGRPSTSSSRHGSPCSRNYLNLRLLLHFRDSCCRTLPVIDRLRRVWAAW